jgi:hypothetical protein
LPIIGWTAKRRKALTSSAAAKKRVSAARRTMRREYSGRNEDGGWRIEDGVRNEVGG